MLVQGTLGDPAVVEPPPLVEQLGLGDLSGHHHFIHRELVWPEVNVEKVEGENEENDEDKENEVQVEAAVKENWDQQHCTQANKSEKQKKRDERS